MCRARPFLRRSAEVGPIDESNLEMDTMVLNNDHGVHVFKCLKLLHVPSACYFGESPDA